MQASGPRAGQCVQARTSAAGAASCRERGQPPAEVGSAVQEPEAASDMRVAYYSPMPPSRSGIADYSALLLPALRRRIDVRVARRRLPLLRRTDVALYH